MSQSFSKWNKAIVGLSMILILAIGVGLGWLLFAESNATDSSEVESVAEADDEETTYYCSMHPHIRSNDPDDKCPICYMDLIPLPSDDDDDASGDLPQLRLTARAAALMQIEVRPVERRDVKRVIRLYGQVDFDERSLRTITAWVPGRLDRLHIDFTGQTVSEGEAMVELFSPTLIAAQEELLQAINTARELGDDSPLMRDRTQLTIDASRDRLHLLGLSREQIAKIEQRGTVADHLTIPAPMRGTVIERLAATGDYVEKGTPIYRLADLSQLWIELEAYESDLAWLHEGQAISFTTQSYPGEVFTGVIDFIDPILNRRTRTVRLRADLHDPDARLKPGMFLNGSIEASLPTLMMDDADASHAADEHASHDAATDQHPLVIPVTAPLITGERAVVYVQIADAERPTYELRQVTLGPKAGNWYVVRDGLRSGELVVTHGAFKIDSELQLRGRPSMMQPDGGRPPGHDHTGKAAESPLRPATQQELADYPLDICVVTELGLDSMGGALHYEHDGKTVLFCCEACLSQFQKDPTTYLKKLEDASTP